MQFSSWYLQFSIRKDEELCFRKWKNIKNQHFYLSWLKNSLKLFYFLKNIFLLKWNKKPKVLWLYFLFRFEGCCLIASFIREINFGPACVLVNSTGRTFIKVKSQWIIDRVLVVLFFFWSCFVLILEQYKYLIQMLCTKKERRKSSSCIFPIGRKNMAKYLSSSSSVK